MKKLEANLDLHTTTYIQEAEESKDSEKIREIDFWTKKSENGWTISRKILQD